MARRVITEPLKRQPRRYAVGIERRRQIIDCAHELFSQQGYRGASMRDIASKAGLTLPGLLHYFPCKEALLEAVLHHRDEVDIPWFEKRWEETGSFKQAVMDLMERSLKAPQVIQLFTTLSAEATDRDHPAHTFFQDRYRTSREVFSGALERAIEGGELRPGASGPLLIAILDGLQIQWLIEPTFDFLGELESYLDTLVVNGNRVDGNRVDGNRVDGNRVNEKRVSASRVSASRVSAKRVNESRVSASRVSAKRVNGKNANLKRSDRR